MSTVVNAIYGIVVLAALLVLPGRALLGDRFPRDATATERWALVAGIGFWAVALLHGALLILPWRAVGVTLAGLRPVLAPTILVAAGALAYVRWWRRRAPGAATLPPQRGDWLALGLAAVVFLVFAIGRDDQLHAPGCLLTAMSAAVGHPVGHVAEVLGPNDQWPALVESLGANERLGNVFASVLPAALFQAAGFRVASGLSAALLFLAVAALGARVTGRRWAGLAAAAALVATGDVSGSEVVNVNLFVAGAAALLLLVLSPAHAGRPLRRTFLAAVLFATRHVALVALGAWLWALWRDAARRPHPAAPQGGAPAARATAGRRLRTLAIHAGWLLVFTLPVHAVHAVMFGSPFGFQSFAEYGAHPHELLGLRFDLHAMLNWPLAPALVRTPFNAFPMWIGWPLHAVQQWGIPAAGLILFGAGLLVRRARRAGNLGPWLLFTIPLALVLGVQENWLQPAKLTIGLVLAPVAAACLATALAWVPGDGWRRRAAALAGVVVAAIGIAAAAGAALAHLRVPEDPRFRVEVPELRAETPAFRAFLRERALRPSWTPLPADPGVFRSFGRKARDAWRTLGAPGFAARRRSVIERLVAYQVPGHDRLFFADRAAAPLPHHPPAAEVRTLRLDLAESPTVAPTPLGRAAPGAGDGAGAGEDGGGVPLLDLTDGRPCAATERFAFRVPFADRAVGLLACRPTAREVALFVVFPTHLPPDAREEWSIGDVRMPADVERAGDFENPDVAGLPLATAARLRLPAAVRRVTIFEVLHYEPNRVYRRDVCLARDGALTHREAATVRPN